MPRHRSIAKHSYLSGKNRGVARAKAHVRYIQFRPDRDGEREERTFFNGLREKIYGKEVHLAVSAQNPKGTVIHKLILSPGAEGADVQEYTREVMAELCSRKGQDLEWYAVAHDNTSNPHAHVVIMGRDENGRTVRLDTRDYDLIKAAGDEYLERNKLLDRGHEREKADHDKDDPDKEKGSITRFVDALKAAAHEFKRSLAQDEKPKDEKPETEYHRRKREKQEELDKEAAALGDDIDLDVKLLLEQKNEERDKADRQRAWQEYCKPVEINYRLADGTIYVAKYDRATSLEGLRDLRKAYFEQDEITRDSLTVDDIKRVNDWIKEKERMLSQLDEKSDRLTEIVIAVDVENNITFTKDSSFEDLQALSELSKRREVYLDPAEEMALAKWLKVQEYKEPILVELERSDEVVHYTMDDSKQVLATLLNEYELGDAVLTSKESERLKSWIESAQEEPDRQITVIEEDEDTGEVATHTYDRQTDYTVLQTLDKGFREGDGRLSQDEYKLLRVWIAEKEAERQLELERRQEQERLQALKEKEILEQEKPIRVYDKEEDSSTTYTRKSKLEDLKKLEEAYLEKEISRSQEKELERLKAWIAQKEREKFDRPIEFTIGEKLQEHSNNEHEARVKEERHYHEKPIVIQSKDKDGPFDEISKNDDLPRLRDILGTRETADTELAHKHLTKEEYAKLESWISEKEQERDRQPLNYINAGENNAVLQVSKDDPLERLRELDVAIEAGGGPSMDKADREVLQKWILDKEENEVRRGDQVLTRDTPLDELQQFREETQKNIAKLEKWTDQKDRAQDKIEINRESSLESLRGLLDSPEIELSEHQIEQVKDWIAEKKQEQDRLPLEYVDRAQDKDVPASETDSIVRQITKDESLDRLQALDRALTEPDGPTMNERDRAVLKEWIADKVAAEEKGKPIEVLERDEDERPVTYTKEAPLNHLRALAAGVESREIELGEKDQEKLKDWIQERERERSLDDKPIQLEERNDGANLPADQPYPQEVSKEDTLEVLKQLDRELDEDERNTTEEEREKLKRWIEEKDQNELEQDKEVLTKNSEHEKLQRTKQEEKTKLEKLEKLIALKEQKEREELAREYEKLDQDRAVDFEKINRVDEEERPHGQAREQISKEDKLEKLKELEASFREAAADERPDFSAEDHEKLKAWIEYKEQNEIEYGDRVYTKDTPLDELQQFRDQLTESRYEDWIEKEKFSQLCSWIKEKEQKQRSEKDIDREEKDTVKEPEENSRARSRSPEAKGAREPDTADRDPDGIAYGQQFYSKDTPLEQLQTFKETLDESRYEYWIEKEDYKKLCGWIKAKEERGEDAFKKGNGKKAREKKGGRDRESQSQKYRPSALEKRMQRALKQDKAERIKNYYAEKAAQKERLEKQQHEAMWERISADKPVVQFINLLRKGAREVQKEVEKFKQKELEKEQAKQEAKPKDLKDKPDRNEKAAGKKPVDVPFPEPKTHLEELANKRARQLAERASSLEKSEPQADKSDHLEKEAIKLKTKLPFPEPKSHLQALANKKAIELARLTKEAQRTKEREEREKLKGSDADRVDKFTQKGLNKLKKDDKSKESGKEKEKEKERERDKEEDERDR